MRFIGVAELSLDGVPVLLRRRHSLALLAYLVLTGRPHAREELATLLAGEVTDEPARKLLRNALADLNGHGLGGYLLTSRHAVAFNVGLPHTSDVAEVESLIAAGAAADPAALAWDAEQSGSELLADLTLRDAPLFEAWLTTEREYRRQQLLQLAHLLLEQSLRAGQVSQTIAVTRRLLAAEPWQEDLHCQLMRQLARAGQLGAALEQYEQCRRDLAEELGVEPQPETTALFERLRAGPRAPRTNLSPSAIDPTLDLIGRADELDAIVQTLSEPTCRLLTLTGLGGNGKTSLALAAAATLAAPAAVADEHRFADGIMLVNLAELESPGSSNPASGSVEQRIATAIGLGLGMAFYGNVDRMDQLTAFLEVKRLLLVLDALERPTDAAAALQTILRRAPGVTMLVTSRSRLDLPEAWTRQVAGLELPRSPADIERAPAGRLFLHEARRAHAPIGPADWPHIARICELTGGSPLALKIAAGWLHTVSCAEIARQLAGGGELLDEASFAQADGPTSLNTLLRSVWTDLPPRERRALRLLAVFPARFDREAAAAIGVTLQQLAALGRRALIERAADEHYALHPLVRQYAGAQLARRPAEDAGARGAHAAYFADFAAKHGPALRERRETHALFDVAYPDVRAAWDWAAERSDVGLLSTLWPGLTTWYQLAGLHRDWAELLALCVARLSATPGIYDDAAARILLGWLSLVQADALQWQGEPDQAARVLETARDYAATTDSAALVARIYLRDGRLLHLKGQTSAAIARLRQAHALAGDTDDPRLAAHTLLSLSYSLADHGEYAEAEAVAHRARELYRGIGDRLSLGRTTLQAGRLHLAWGDYPRARVLLEQSLHLHREFHDRPSEMLACTYLGSVLGDGLGRRHDARLHFDRALVIAQQMHDRGAEALVQTAYGHNELLVGDFDRAQTCFEQALTAGRGIGSPAAESRALLGLGYVALARDEAVTAADRAEQALHLATSAERRHEQALAWLLLGQACERLDRGADAAQAFGHARDAAETLELPNLYGDAVTGLANAALVTGNVDPALRYAAELPPYFHKRRLGGSSEPGWVTLSCYRVFQAAGDPRADDLLRQGAEILERQAAALPRQQRARYLEAFPARRAVLDRWAEQRAATNIASQVQTQPIAPGSPHHAPDRRRTPMASPLPAAPDHPEQG